MLDLRRNGASHRLLSESRNNGAAGAQSFALSLTSRPDGRRRDEGGRWCCSEPECLREVREQRSVRDDLRLANDLLTVSYEVILAIDMEDGATMSPYRVTLGAQLFDLLLPNGCHSRSGRVGGGLGVVEHIAIGIV